LLILSLFCFSLFAKTVKVGWFLKAGIQDGQSDEDLGGYNYEYLCRIAQYANWDLDFEYGTLAECLNWLETGKIDLVGAIGITEDRKNNPNLNFAPIPNINNSIIMVCKKDNTKLTYGDFKAIDGLNLAICNTAYDMGILGQSEKEFNFTVNVIDCGNGDQALDAVKTNETDIALIFDTYPFDKSLFKVILKTTTKPSYFVVNSKANDIFSELNDAVNQIMIDTPFYNETLFDKYFSSSKKIPIAFTKTEEAYLQTKPTLNVGFTTFAIPFSYINKKTKELDGIVLDYLNYIHTTTGLKFNYKIYNSKEEIKTAMIKGECDISAGEPNLYNSDVLQYKKYTQPYFNLPLGLLYYQKNKDKIKTVAFAQGNNWDEQIRKANYEPVPYTSLEDCVKAVTKGQIDAALINSYYYETLSYQIQYKILEYELLPTFNLDISFGISKATNKNLYSILEKSIGNIPEDIDSSIILQNKTNVGNLTLAEKLGNHLLEYIILFVIFMLLLTIIILLHKSNIQKQKSKKLLEEKNKKLNKSIKQVQFATDSKTNFLLSVSHDMRTPMNAIITLDDIALQNLNDQKQVKESLEIIHYSSILLHDLINNLLDMSSIERGTLKLEAFKCIDLKKHITELENLIKVIAKSSNITFKTVVNIKDQFVFTDSQKLQRIVINLINNSLKYTKEGGSVTLIVTQNDDFSLLPNFKENKKDYNIYTIAVKDTGIGISQDQIKHVFEKFYQVSPENNNLHNNLGIGLGLSITKEMIELLKGNISIDSKLGIGSTFTVNLPLKVYKPKENFKKLEIPKKVNYNFKGKKVLIVDDNSINLLVLNRILKEANLTIVQAVNGKEAVDKFLESKPGEYSIILMDLLMPIMNGMEATKAIRASSHPDSKTIPILAVSANTFDNKNKKLLDLGLQGYLLKPINVKDLMENINKYLK